MTRAPPQQTGEGSFTYDGPALSRGIRIMIRAFDLALRQLGDPELRGVLWQSLLLSLVLQVAIAVLAWWTLQHFAVFQWEWVNAAIRWLGAAAVVVLALL